MKIHLHTPSFFPRLVGMTYATHVHAELLSELGAEVTVIAPCEPGVEAGPGDLGYAVRRFAVSGSGMPWSPVRGRVTELIAWTAQERPDIVIAEGWFTPGARLLRALKPHARHVVLSSHGSADLTLKRASLAQLGRHLAYRWTEVTEVRRTARAVSAAILLTRFRDRDRFRDAAVFDLYGVPAFIAANPSTYSAPEAPRTLSETPAMLHVGEMTPHKNQRLAVEVLAGLPATTRLTLAYPRPTPYLQQVLDTADRLGVRARVRLVEGHDRTALESVFDASDLLLITSVSEAQPIIAADALIKGMPFVSTPVGCMPEFMGGTVAKPGDLTAAAAGILADRQVYRRVSAEAREYYEAHLARSKAMRSLGDMLGALA